MDQLQYPFIIVIFNIMIIPGVTLTFELVIEYYGKPHKYPTFIYWRYYILSTELKSNFFKRTKAVKFSSQDLNKYASSQMQSLFGDLDIWH